MAKTNPVIARRKVVFFVLGGVILALWSCQRDSESKRDLAAGVSQKAVAAQRKRMLPDCPDAPYPKLQAKDSGTGHHRVFLRWNGSSSASENDANALGYCLYRTQKAGRAKDCPTNGPSCEPVNVVPITETRCVDELVKDNTTYYYVVIAITGSDTSTTSEEAIAEVPASGKQNPPPADADSYPACRTPTPAAPPPHP